MNITDSMKMYGLKKAYEYLDKDPEENIPKLVSLVEKYWPSAAGTQIQTAKKYLSDPDNNWYKLVQSLFTDIDDGVRKVLFENFLIHGFMEWKTTRQKYAEKYDCNIPWTILMDPTSACNLHCTGCWAAEYGNKLNLTFEQLDSIICQAKELGMHVFLFTGGEPLVRKDDIIRLCEKHNDCVFSSFTNGTLIDEKFADEMLRVKNFVPAISVEGFEEATDFRRGKGTFQKIMRAMDILQEHKLPFGVSLCYHHYNYKNIGSEEFFDWLIARGAKFAWMFTYMPIGKDAPTDLMVTAEERKYMYEKVREYRKTKPIFTMDFWNDGEYVKGCIAGGRHYFHINANGDADACAFVHYSNYNIKEHTLIECLQQPIFQEYRKGQPWNKDHLRPCPLLDNPDALMRAVERSGAHSTDLEAPEDVHDLCDKCREKAAAWGPVADDIWVKTGHSLD